MRGIKSGLFGDYPQVNFTAETPRSQRKPKDSGNHNSKCELDADKRGSRGKFQSLHEVSAFAVSYR